jgi:hypothetical protein
MSLKVSLVIEPSSGNSVIYQRLAMETTNSVHRVKIGLIVVITNNETINIVLNKIKIIFKNSPAEQGLVFEYDSNLLIPNSETATWGMHGGPLGSGGQHIVLDQVPSLSASLDLVLEFLNQVDGSHLGSVTTTKSLIHDISPFHIRGYYFPGKARDLLEGEYWQSPDSHASGGEQIFAHDLGVMKYNPLESNFFQWRLKQDMDGKYMNGTENWHYRVWEKPVYAMAKGTVIDVENDQEENIPGATTKKENHVWIQHGAEAVAYAHFKFHTIDTSKIYKGAEVSQGQFLGQVGNTGGSSEPHLHIHAIKGTAVNDGHLRPLLFTNISILSYDELMNSSNPQWVDVQGYGLPAIWASVYPKPEEYYKENVLDKWNAVVHILFGVIGGGGGVTYYPSGKPGPPIDPLPLRLRNLSSAKRDIIVGIAISELAEILSDSKSKLELEKTGISVISRALKQMNEELVSEK